MSAAAPEPEPVEAVVYVECPMCGEISLTRHCKSTGCRWQTCQKSTCDATLDRYKGFGQYRHPEGIRDKVTNAISRVYLVLDRRGVWRERAE